LVKPGGDIDVGERADAASEREPGKPGDHVQALVSISPIGDFIVEDEIARHRDKRGDDLRGVEVRGSNPMTKRRERENMDDEAEGADQGEQHESNGQEPAARVVGDQAEKLKTHERRQL
jgi:hypothetical protein